MTLTRFVPLRSGFASNLNDVALLQNRLNSIFHDFARPEAASEALGAGHFVPAVDVYEDSAKLVLKLEVPGIKQEDMDINVENQTLTVRGERKLESDEKGENFHRVERRFGSFVRTFTLPTTVDTGTVAARYEHGVLRIELKKTEAAKPRAVKIDVAGTDAAPKQVEGATAQ